MSQEFSSENLLPLYPSAPDSSSFALNFGDLLLHEKNTNHLKKKNPTADLSYNFSVHQFLLVHFTCHRQLWWSFFPSIQSSPVYPRGNFSLYCNLHIAREYITVAKMFWMHRLVPCVALAPSHPCWHFFDILCSLNCNDHFFASSSLIFYHMIIISVRQWCWSYL